MSSGTVPKPDTAPQVHQKVLSLLEPEPRGRILDMGSWEGALSLALERMGFQVFACDIANYMKVPHIPWQQWDLNTNHAPYPESFFDYIACVEVMEHLENPHHLIRVIARLLKGGGKLVISMPNILSLWSRLLFLPSGRFSGFPARDEDHINPIPFWELERILKKNRLTVEQITINKPDKLGLLLRPLTYLLFKPQQRLLLEGNIFIVKAAKLTPGGDKGC